MVRDPIAEFDVFMKDGRYAVNQHSLVSYFREFFKRQKSAIEWLCVDVIDEGTRHSWTNADGWKSEPINPKTTRRRVIERRTRAVLNPNVFTH